MFPSHIINVTLLFSLVFGLLLYAVCLLYVFVILSYEKKNSIFENRSVFLSLLLVPLLLPFLVFANEFLVIAPTKLDLRQLSFPGLILNIINLIAAVVIPLVILNRNVYSPLSKYLTYLQKCPVEERQMPLEHSKPEEIEARYSNNPISLYSLSAASFIISKLVSNKISSIIFCIIGILLWIAGIIYFVFCAKKLGREGY